MEKEDGLEEYRKALADIGFSSFQHETRASGETRSEMYKSLPSNAIVAEIGVAAGVNAVIIDELCTPKELYLIDPWDYCELSSTRWPTEEHKEKAHTLFSDKSNTTIIQDFSIEASKRFENRYFDWVFIDAYPDYGSVKTDLAHWLPKIKKGGYITGDEFAFDKLPHWEGVYTAVIEFILEHAAKRPDLIEQMKETYENLRTALTKPLEGSPTECLKKLRQAAKCNAQIKIQNEQVLFGSISVSLNFKIDIDFKAPASVAEILKEYMDYYPSTRVRGGIYKIKVGDWVDDLNCEKIIKDLTIDPPLPRELNTLNRYTSNLRTGPWEPLVRTYGLSQLEDALRDPVLKK